MLIKPLLTIDGPTGSIDFVSDYRASNLGIFTPSGGKNFYIAANNATGKIIFETNSTAQLTIQSDGGLLMGTAPTSANSTALCWDNSGASLITDCTSGPSADYAEMYPVERDVEYGEIVMLGSEMVNTYDNNGNEVLWDKVLGKIPRLKKAADASKLIGIVSNNYGDFSSTGHNIKDEDNPKPVALKGRVPLKVNLEGGNIKVGDKIGLSSVPGVGKKITKGQSVGTALEPYNKSANNNTILVFVDLAYIYDESFVPIWDGKIDSVLTEINDIKKRLEVVERKIK